MNELVRHIETLLLENDCVVVPNFGGFITHYMPASWDDKDQVFSPPVRTIGFNPQLKMNDGILVQSYMEAYNTDFSDATRILGQKINELVDVLHKEGVVYLANIGELSLSVHGTYLFTPYDDKIISPILYGLDSFEIQALNSLRHSSVEKGTASLPATPKRTYDIRINRAFVRNAVAAVAAVLLFFYMSTPIENTHVERVNYAQLLPTDFLGQIEQHSLLTTSVAATNTKESEVPAATATTEVESIESAEDKEDKIEQDDLAEEMSLPAIKKRYHIVVASVASEKEAQNIASKLKANGYSDTSILSEGKKVRVSIDAYSTREEADAFLAELRKDNAYKTAWLLVR